ncbi:thiamine biosynthesis protein [Wenyingzhuangia fucanilytica]|uniref:Thiamine biosynthesis protein n=1 Tax=Wenyingzhuangia fucanilytica TaxID=1790137 RepID=A0A1B1Y8B3_9FLAO|nr:sulfur carrier protein ThiS [Wenyingzhuangia fucanilytica]ANW97007.1 thiamine biosynthesis protein [Wenyingzhuangia fucanilytica]
MITVKVNNLSKEISENSSVEQLLLQLSQPGNGIAVAINQQIISKSNWNQHQLNQGDDVLIIQATQGG